MNLNTNATIAVAIVAFFATVSFCTCAERRPSIPTASGPNQPVIVQIGGRRAAVVADDKGNLTATWLEPAK